MPFTLAGLALGACYLLIQFIFDTDFFELFIEFLWRYEPFELDEFVFAGVIFLLGMCVDFAVSVLSRQQRLRETRRRLELLQAAMECLGDLIQFRLDAEMDQRCHPDALRELDELIDRISHRFNSLAEAEVDMQTLTPNLPDEDEPPTPAA